MLSVAVGSVAALLWWVFFRASQGYLDEIDIRLSRLRADQGYGVPPEVSVDSFPWSEMWPEVLTTGATATVVCLLASVAPALLARQGRLRSAIAVAVVTPLPLIILVAGYFPSSPSVGPLGVEDRSWWWMYATDLAQALGPVLVALLVGLAARPEQGTGVASIATPTGPVSGSARDFWARRPGVILASLAAVLVVFLGPLAGLLVLAITAMPAVLLHRCPHLWPGSSRRRLLVALAATANAGSVGTEQYWWGDWSDAVISIAPSAGALVLIGLAATVLSDAVDRALARRRATTGQERTPDTVEDHADTNPAASSR